MEPPLGGENRPGDKAMNLCPCRLFKPALAGAANDRFEPKVTDAAEAIYVSFRMSWLAEF